MSYTQFSYHIVFSTKHREPSIPEEFEKEVYALVYHIIKREGGHIYRIGGMPDHIHILASFPAKTAVSTIVQSIKRETSAVLSQHSGFPRWQGWEEGYGGFTCGHNDIPAIREYIMGQKEHHRKITFYDELRQWLIENGASGDEPYFPKQ